jgi:hypothetical protein
MTDAVEGRIHKYRNAVSMESNSGKDGGPLMRITWEAWHATKAEQVKQQQTLYWGIKNFMEETEMKRAEEGTGVNVAKGNPQRQ